MASVRCCAATLLLSLALATGCGDHPEGGDDPDGGVPDAGPPDAGPPEPLIDPVVDLRADVDRDGHAELGDPADEEGEDAWTPVTGAILLANLDDDAERCSASLEDAPEYADDVMAACHDAADEEINGVADLLDLAPLRTAPWPGAPDDAVGELSVSGVAASRVRLFRWNGASYEVLPLGATLDASALRSGLELRIEATDVVRDRDVWDGRVDLRFRVQRQGAPATAVWDVVQLRVAPILLSHAGQPARRLGVVVPSEPTPGAEAFRDAVANVSLVAGLPEPLLEFAHRDRWMQDFFEAGYAAMPGPDGPQVMQVLVRSAWVENSSAIYSPLRRASRIVYFLRGPDVAVVQQYQLGQPWEMKTLDAMGNVEVVPPHTHAGAHYPFGRIVRGRTDSWYPDPSLTELLEAQEVQAPIYLDTSWLFVGHVDETLAFVPSSIAPRGWVTLVADPNAAYALLEDVDAAGHGDALLFAGRTDRFGAPVERSVADVLADATLAEANALAAARIASQLEVLQAEVGLSEVETLRVPVMFFPRTTGRLASYLGNLVNLVAPTAGLVAAAEPHGPLVDGVDPFRAHFEDLLAPHGVEVLWVDTWDYLHVYVGEIHCGTNTLRQVPETGWWTQL